MLDPDGMGAGVMSISPRQPADLREVVDATTYREDGYGD